jgi:hypothetical protein
MTKIQEGAPDAPSKAMTINELTKAARTHSELALKTLASIMNGDGQDSVKLGAAREMLDRAHGRTDARARKTKAPKAGPKPAGMTVIVKRFSDVTPQDEAEHDATQALFE